MPATRRFAGKFVDGDGAHLVAGDEDQGRAGADRLPEERGLDQGFCGSHEGAHLRIVS